MLRFVISILVIFYSISVLCMTKAETRDALKQAKHEEGNMRDLIHQAKSEYKQLESSGELVKNIKKEYAKVERLDTSNTGYNFDSIENKTLNSLSNINIDEFKTQMDVAKEKLTKRNVFFIMVSFSMPEQVLLRYMSQAKKINAGVVFRGFLNNSYLQTIERMQALNIGSGFSIDPTLFSKFSVTKVPAFILTLEGEKVCRGQSSCSPPEHIKATGTMSVRSFLELASQQNNKANKVANTWLSKLNM